MIANEFFDILQGPDLEIKLSDEQKQSLIFYCGGTRYNKSKSKPTETVVLLEYKKLENLTSVALEYPPPGCFNYL